MHLCVFEDTQSVNLLPLTYFRPVYDLRCGALTLRERILAYLQPAKVSLFARTYLAGVLQEEGTRCEVNSISSPSCLFVNGRVVMTGSLARSLKKGKDDVLFLSNGTIVAMRLSGANLRSALSSGYADVIDLSRILPLPEVEVEAGIISYPWDLVYANETTLAEDFTLLTRKNGRRIRSEKLPRNVHSINRSEIHIARGATVGAGAVLDASHGPILADERAVIMPLAYIEGPCYIGKGATIKAGTRVYESTSIGPLCKVGGEIGHSVFHSHANKQHDGYVGHSYLSPWVNLGAGTTTSNLKNTYGSIRVEINGRRIDSGKMFVGMIAADHVKIGINGTIDTGSVIGPSSNVYGTALPPKVIPAFTWGTTGNFTTYDEDRAFAVATTVMSRRNVEATAAYKQVFHEVFEMTNDARTTHRN
jgi:UDP-N-acetylglucosamine diphosphorylase / glucose-1-phosphate thymidylyltransferase / UDP-N-acetylgalactosamine diphosphorylase / glucosamine-1-phosphate N-acetyltransferase / galactosamine-1-phosphate N-acetyltransferase